MKIPTEVTAKALELGGQTTILNFMRKNAVAIKKSIMKPALVLLALAPMACMAPTTIQMRPALQRTIERVVDRHDAYVLSDALLSDADREGALAESAQAAPLLWMGAVPSGILSGTLDPVMNRHDLYVMGDASLDLLNRDTYLETTVRLRALFGSVPAQ